MCWRTVCYKHQDAGDYLEACKQNREVAWSCYYAGDVSGQIAATDKSKDYHLMAVDRLNAAEALLGSVCVPCGGFDAKTLVQPR
jgi:hypothetical protein